MKKVLNRILTVLLVVVLIVVAFISVVMIISSKNDGVANVFGYSPIVLHDTKSMEPKLTASDLVIVKKQDFSNLKEGQIISFRGVLDGKDAIITHQIVEVIHENDGTCSYQTQGINKKTNPLRDQDPANATWQGNIEPSDIIGVYSTHIPGLGAVMNFLKTPLGILVCLVIPIALIFLWQLYRVIRIALAIHREETAKQSAQMKEDEKQRVIEEYLRQQQEAQNAKEEGSDESDADPAVSEENSTQE